MEAETAPTAEAPTSVTPDAPASTAETPTQEPSLREQVSAPAGQPQFNVPDEYKDRSWASKVKSEEDLYKQIDNLTSLVGKKDVPSADATDEQLEEFYSKLRPETADAYDIKLPENVDPESINQEEMNAYKDVFHKNGLTEKQANDLYNAYYKIEAGKTAQYDAQFDEIIKGQYGDKANDAVKTALKYVGAFDPEAKAQFSQAQPELMAAVVKMMNDHHSQYGDEDTIPSETGGNPAQTKEDVLKELTQTRISAKNTVGDERAKSMQRIEELQKRLNS